MNSALSLLRPKGTPDSLSTSPPLFTKPNRHFLTYAILKTPEMARLQILS